MFAAASPPSANENRSSGCRIQPRAELPHAVREAAAGHAALLSEDGILLLGPGQCPGG